MSYIVTKKFYSAEIGDIFEPVGDGVTYVLEQQWPSYEAMCSLTMVLRDGASFKKLIADGYLAAVSDEDTCDESACLYDKVIEFVDLMADQYREDLKEAENEPSKVVQLEKRTVLTNMLRLIAEIKSIA